MAKKTFWQKVKGWLSGDKGGSKKSAPKPRQNRDAREEVVSSNTRPSTRRAIVNTWKNGGSNNEASVEKPKPTYKSMAEATSKNKGLNEAFNAKTDKYLKMQDSVKKQPPEARSEKKNIHQENLATLAARRQEKHGAYHEATHHRYDVAEEGISKEERERRKQNIRTATLGEMMGGRDDEAADVMKAKMKYDKVGESLRRGIANTATAGIVRLGEKRLNKGERKEAEDIYQENKSKAAETVGSLIGGMALYGGTAGTFEGLGQKAVGKAAATQVGKKLGAEKLAKTMAGEGIKAGLARSLVGDAIQDSTIGAFDTTMDVLSRDDLETPKDYAKAFAEGQAANYAMGLAGNAAFNVALPAAGRAARNAWGNFADESRRLYAVDPSTRALRAITEPDKNGMVKAIDDTLSREEKVVLRNERDTLASQRDAIAKSIEDDYGDINPDYRALTPEQQADVRSRKGLMREISARINDIHDELAIVRSVPESSINLEARANGANVDVPENKVYNNSVQEAIDNGTEIGNVRTTQAGGEPVSAVDAEIPARGGADNGVVAGVADATVNGRGGSGDVVLRVTPEHRAKLTESGVTDTHLSDVSDNYAAFSNALDRAREANNFGSWVDPKSVDELAEKGAKTFLSDDGSAGVAVEKDGNISGVFKNPLNSKYNGAAYDLLFTARANGGTKMDCFGAKLANLYEKCGYKVVAKVPFNPEYVSDPKLLKLRPDVYVLMKNADDLDTVASKIGKPKSAGGYQTSTFGELNDVRSFDDYGEALAYRDSLLKQQEAEIAAKANAKGKTKRNAKGTKSAAKELEVKEGKGKKTAEKPIDHDAAKRFRKNRSKKYKELKERYKAIDEIYDADKKGEWVFYKDKSGELCVGDPSKEHGSHGLYGKNGDYFGKLTQENFDRAKKAFDDGNLNPTVPRGKTKVETPEPKTKSGVDPLKTYKEKVAKQKAEAKSKEVAAQKVVKAEAEPKAEVEVEPPKPKKVKSQAGNKLYTFEVQGKSGTRTVEVEAKNKSEARQLATSEEGDKSAMFISEKAIESKVEPKTELPEAKAETPKNAGKKQGAKKQTKNKKATQEPEQEGFDKDYAVLKEKYDEADRLRGRIKVAQGANKEALEGQLKALEKEIQFDKDFADFRRKVGNAKTNIAELENKLRVAEGKEAKAAIRKQINAIKKDVKKAHNKAGLRYHPDKGGSDEWMARFNEAYDSFENGGKGGNVPKGKNVKPTRTVENVEDIVHKTKESKSAKEDVKNAWQATRRKSTNSMVTFEDENLKTIKNDPDGWDRRNASIDKTRRSNALANVSATEAQLKADGTRYSGTVERIGADGKTYKIQNGKSLQEIYSGMDEKKEAAFDAYLLLKHAPDRIREGTPIFDAINLKAKDGEVIRSLNDPVVVKEEAERLLRENPEFAQKAEEIYQYTHNELENRVTAGLLSQKKASEWMHDHPFYVPSGRDGYFNAAHGNHKGVVGADSFKAAKGSDLDIRSIKEQLAEATSRNWRDITSNELLEEFFGSKVGATRADTKGLKLLNETVGLSKSADGRKYYAKIFRDGKMHRVEIDKNFYDDLEDLYKNGSVGTVMDTVARATSKVSSPFKKLVTTWNPIFLPKNFSRDMQDALINTRQTKEFVECLAPAWKELSNGGEYARAFQDSGVSQSNFVNLDEALNKGGKLGKAVDKFIALQDMTESFPRLAEYMATLKKAGVDITKPLSEQNVSPRLLDRAAANAADVTVNFGRSGSVGKNLNKGLVPFLNPSIQGWSKFVRNFREQKGTKQLLATIAKSYALGAGVLAVNNFLLSDNPNYQQISNREKATNIIIAIPPFKDGHINNDADTFIKIPRGRFAAVYGLSTVNAFNENDMGWAEMVKVARDQVLPVDPTESSIVAPLYAAHNNKTWYGAPIESDYLVENFSPSERYDERTTPLGKALGKATSGLPEELQISPKKADYIADAATGVVGDFLLPMSTAFANKSGVLEAGKGVVKKAFTIDSATQSGMYSQYNDMSARLTHKKNAANASEADKKAYEKFSGWDSRVKAASNAMRYVQNSDLPNKQEAYRELAKLRNDNMQKALDGKRSINNSKDIDIIHKYAGTSYTIENLGKSADKDALKAYGAAVYGKLSEDEMRKKIDSDTEFYKGYQGIVKTQNALQKVDPKLKGGNALTYAVGLADAGANDDVFASYGTTLQSRTESASKAQRAKDYLDNNGSVEEFAQLENAVKNLGKLSDVDKDRLEDEAYEKLQSGKMSIDEYKTELKKIDYNANQSYVGKAVSLAMSGAPARAYNLYDIKEKNVQKGYNLAAMGIDSRQYREMSQACDKDGNGYLKTAEIRDYVANSDYEDKATLFDALCYYSNVRNPFGTPKRYSSEQAAEIGRSNGVAQIKANAGADNTVFADSKSSGSSYGGYGGYRSRYRSGYRYGGGGGSKKATPPKINAKSMAAATKKVKGTTVKLEPPSPKDLKVTTKFKEYKI